MNVYCSKIYENNLKKFFLVNYLNLEIIYFFIIHSSCLMRQRIQKIRSANSKINFLVLIEFLNDLL